MKLTQAIKRHPVESILTVISLAYAILALILYLIAGTNKLALDLNPRCITALIISGVLGIANLALGAFRGKLHPFLAYGEYLFGLWAWGEYIISQANYIANVFYGVDGNSFTAEQVVTLLTGLLCFIAALTAGILLRRGAYRADQPANEEA